MVLAACIFLGFGLWLFCVPEALAGIGIVLETPEARIDIRATYGGMELGFATFLLLCASRPEWTHVGLVASACGIAGFGLGRLGGILLEGEGTSLMWIFLGIELAATGVYLAAIRASSAESAGSDDAEGRSVAL